MTRVNGWKEAALWLASGLVAGGLLMVILAGQQAVRTASARNLQMAQTDVDVMPAIDVIHTPPVMAQVGETINLSFIPVCKVSVEGAPCDPDITLELDLGQGKGPQMIELTREGEQDLPTWSMDVPLQGPMGSRISYALVLREPLTGADIRYPAFGTLDVFVTDQFAQVKVPAPQGLATPEAVVFRSWGPSDDQVGLDPIFAGPAGAPSAFDIGPKGEVALMDPYNERVLIIDPLTDRQVSYRAEVTSMGDIEYADDGSLLFLDFNGAIPADSFIHAPELFRLTQGDTAFRSLGPVYAARLSGLSDGGLVVDEYAGRRVADVMGVDGHVVARSEQQSTWIEPEVLFRYVDGQHLRFADPAAGFAFELVSEVDLGVINGVRRTEQGYVVVLDGKHDRVLYLSPNGEILKDVVFPVERYTSLTAFQNIVMQPNGDVYVLDTTAKGVVVLHISMGTK